MTSTDIKFFLDRKFFIHLRRANQSNIDKSTELIKLFGGQIEQFLETSISYVLTDIPKSEWPPHGNDSVLVRARQNNIKLMSLAELISWCSKYVNSQSSSDDDDDQGARIKLLTSPYIKLEDYNCCFATSVREFVAWPTICLNQDIPIGKSIFCDNYPQLGTPNTSVNNVTNQINQLNNTSAQLTPQAMLPRGAKRKHSVFCEVCNIRLTEKIDDHISTQTHMANIEKLDWTDVDKVIDCLPGFNSLNRHRLSDLSVPKGAEYQEFVCLHKMDSVSQLFHTSGKVIDK